jgi:hypothetical protein
MMINGWLVKLHWLENLVHLTEGHFTEQQIDILRVFRKSLQYSLRCAICEVNTLPVAVSGCWYFCWLYPETISEDRGEACLGHSIPEEKLIVQAFLERQESHSLACFSYFKDTINFYLEMRVRISVSVCQTLLN